LGGRKKKGKLGIFRKALSSMNSTFKDKEQLLYRAGKETKI